MRYECWYAAGVFVCCKRVCMQLVQGLCSAGVKCVCSLCEVCMFVRCVHLLVHVCSVCVYLYGVCIIYYIDYFHVDITWYVLSDCTLVTLKLLLLHIIDCVVELYNCPECVCVIDCVLYVIHWTLDMGYRIFNMRRGSFLCQAEWEKGASMDPTFSHFREWLKLSGISRTAPSK